MATETAGPLTGKGPTSTGQTSTAYVFLVAAVVSLGSFLMGYSLVIISGAIIFLKTAFSLTPTQLGFAVSSSAIGCLLGPLVGGSIGDLLGRKKALSLTGVVFAASAIGTAFPTN